MPVDKKPFSPIWIMIFLTITYFVVMIFPNQQGTENYWMLAVFEVDEFAQYPHVLQLLNPAESLTGTLRNFAVYDHYFYGYPFYFFSGISLLPIRLILGEGWQDSTTLLMTTLRQLINVLPNLISVWLLTYVGTKFKHRWKTLGLFVFLMISPALLKNSLWWHPDGLGLMFVSLTMFFLTMDNLGFKKFYWLAAVSTGIAFGIKYTGLFFVLVIPLYLALGIFEKKIVWKKALLFAIGFVALMVASVVLSNPLLLTPTRSLIIENQKLQFDQTTSGIFVVAEGFFANGKLPEWFTTLYGNPLLFLLLLTGIVLSLWRKETRGKAVLLLAWVLPYSWVVLNSGAQRSLYWLPILLPAYLVIIETIPDAMPFKGNTRRWENAVFIISTILLSSQIGFSLREDVDLYQKYLHKEESSAALQFSIYVKEQIIHPAFEQERFNIYRDWHIYYPADEAGKTFMDWELADYSLIEAKQPDFLLLERANVVTYGDPDYLVNSPDPERTKPMHTFYADALKNQINGYDLLYEDAYGFVFQKDVSASD